MKNLKIMLLSKQVLMINISSMVSKGNGGWFLGLAKIILLSVSYFFFLYLLTTAYIYDFISDVDINKYPLLPKWNDSDKTKYQNYIDQGLLMFCWLSDEHGNGPILQNWMDFNTMFDEIIPIWEVDTEDAISTVVFLSSSKFYHYKNL